MDNKKCNFAVSLHSISMRNEITQPLHLKPKTFNPSNGMEVSRTRVKTRFVLLSKCGFAAFH